MIRSQRTHSYSALGRRGGALVLVLIGVVMLAGLSLALMGVTVENEQEGESSTAHIRSLYAAEAGVAQAVAALNTGVMDTSGKNAVLMSWGSENAPIDLESGRYWTDANYDGDSMVTVQSFGAAGGRARGIEVVLVRNLSPIYMNAIFAGNSSGDPAYDLKFGGKGSQADQIQGDVYSGGNIVVDGEAKLYDDIRAQGTITGDTGETGVYIAPPDLASMKYEVNHDVNVAANFGAATYKSNVMGGKAWQMPESDPAHIFRKNPSDRTADTSKTAKDDYFLEDPYETVKSSPTVTSSSGTHITLSGQDGNPGPDGSNLVYYIDGNLWIHNPNIFSFTMWGQVSETVRATFVVKGNVYISDNIFYSDQNKDAVAFIALKDDSEPDSGNIYFGDPSFGTLEHMEAFMFAENNFFDNNLNSSGSARVTVRGNMTAGNQVKITRDWGSQHSKLTVQYDDRLATGAVSLPGLPGAGAGGRPWVVATWREIGVQ
ncbi:MAG TPA: pilus assembly PilX N-terminal domain-containing protein [Planctomycetota bacterium]|nr:pilus assembly PilX N-terminal domain-containing protein [Planctomycetota bacterium]